MVLGRVELEFSRRSGVQREDVLASQGRAVTGRCLDPFKRQGWVLLEDLVVGHPGRDAIQFSQGLKATLMPPAE